MVTKETAKKRRQTIEAIILDYTNHVLRSVDDWYHIVGQRWPDGWDDAPAKNTVKKVLQDMHYKKLIAWRWYERGWFSQERFG